MESPGTKRLLLVEDDQSLADWVKDYLCSKGYEVNVTGRGDDAVSLIQETSPDLVILDGMLPGMDGLDVCKTVRPDYRGAIIMLTARDEEIDEVLGLEVGADDYLTKPVKPRILLARVKALLRRNEATQVAAEQDTKLQFAGLCINKDTHVVTLDNQPVKISSNEFDVLWLLASRAGELVSREQLVTQLRGFEYDGFDRSIDLRISRLRKKLKDDPNEPFRIKTIWGKGYLFAKEAWK